MAKDVFLNDPAFIIGKGLITAETIAQDLRARLIDRLSRGRQDALDVSALLQIAREELSLYEPFLASTLADSQIASWIAGAETVSSILPASLLEQLSVGLPFLVQRPVSGFTRAASGLFISVEDALDIAAGPILEPLPGLSPDEPAVRFPGTEAAAKRLESLNIVPSNQLDALGESARQSAFTVAGIDKEETLVKIREALIDDVVEGGTLEQFENRMADTIGTSNIGPGHLETIYRTNIQTAYSEGQEAIIKNPIIGAAFPYVRYDAIRDLRVRDEHLDLEKLGLDGTNIYRADDPNFQPFLPPWDFG